MAVLGDIANRAKELRKGNQNQTKIGVRETELGRSDESSLGHIGQEMRASADTKMNPRDFFREVYLKGTQKSTLPCS